MTIFNYTVNYVDLIIVGIALVFFIVGLARGLFITLINLIRYILGFFLCMFASNRLSQPIYDSFIKERIVNALSKKVVTSANIDEILDNLNSFVNSLPSFIKNTVDLSKISLGSGNDVATSLADNIFQPIALSITKGIIFILVFILFFGITGIIIHAIRRHNKKKKDSGKKSLKGIDRFFGGIFGLVKGAVIIFVFVSVVSFLMSVGNFADNSFFKEASNSFLYNTILDFNPFNVITEGLI